MKKMIIEDEEVKPLESDISLEDMAQELFVVSVNYARYDKYEKERAWQHFVTLLKDKDNFSKYFKHALENEVKSAYKDYCDNYVLVNEKYQQPISTYTMLRRKKDIIIKEDEIPQD